MSSPLSARFEFLRIESDLAMTFIGAARSYSSPENSARALGNARTALKQIRRGLANPIGLATREIEFLEQRCIEIESALLVFGPATQE